MINKKIKSALLLGSIAITINIMGMALSYFKDSFDSTFELIVRNVLLVFGLIFMLPFHIFTLIIFLGYYAPPPTPLWNFIGAILTFLFYFSLGYFIQYLRGKRSRN